jgi:hypothetical protein
MLVAGDDQAQTERVAEQLQKKRKSIQRRRKKQRKRKNKRKAEAAELPPREKICKQLRQRERRRTAVITEATATETNATYDDDSSDEANLVRQ